MNSDRTLAVLEMFQERSSSSSGVATWCVVARDFTGLTGAGVVLHVDGAPLISVCASSSDAESLIELEVTVGEGPCSDACDADELIDQPDLSRGASTRWPIYAPLARDVGASAVFGFPVRIGAVRIGALLLFRDEPGELTNEQSADAYTVASVVARAILAAQAGYPQDAIANELLGESSSDVFVHQAAGMVSVQGRMSVGDAIVALRAHAFATGESLGSLCARVVARELELDPATSEWRALDG